MDRTGPAFRRHSPRAGCSGVLVAGPVLARYEAHYNGRRPHRSRQLQPPRPSHPVADLNQERIEHRAILGSLINEYERTA